MIDIKQLTKRFKRLTVLQQVTVQLLPGQVISLIGPNGSGKTTLIKCILGMVKPNEGGVFVNNQLVNDQPAYRSAIGYMPQISRYPDNMTVGQLFDLLRTLRKQAGERTDNDLLEKYDLKSIYQKRMHTLSGGTRQKVSAAIAFLFNPSILILDEPTAGLDPLAAEILKEKIKAEKEKGKLILITSHVLSDLEEFTTHVMYLQEGSLVFIKDVATLREETGEIKLGKAMARIMSGQRFITSTTDQLIIHPPVSKDQV